MRYRPLLLALLLPAACTAPEPRNDAAEVLQEVLATHQASIAGIGRPAAVATEPATPAATRPAGVAPPPAGAPPALAGQLVGQTPDTVVAWLGEPRLRRSEGEAEVWHYQASHCHLDLVLYREEAARPVLRVGFASARAVGTARRGEAACLRDIARGAGRMVPAGVTEQAEAAR